MSESSGQAEKLRARLTRPHAADCEFDSGTSLVGSYAIAVGSGSLTNAQITDPFSGSPSNPTYNINQDRISGLLMQPQAGGSMKVYVPFAPATGTTWLYCAKVGIMNTLDVDDRIHVGLTKTAGTPTSDDAPDDSIWLELRAIASSPGLEISDFYKNGGSLQARENNTGWSLAGSIYVLFVGLANNSIKGFYSQDGLTWRFLKTFSGLNINGAVTHAWVSALDQGSNAAFACVVDFMRFYAGANNPYLISYDV